MKNQSFPKRLGFAFQGILHALKHESSFRIQSVMAVLAVAVFAYCRASPVWWALLGATVSLVLALELINTSLENILDRLHPDFHPLIRVAKDCSAAGVLVASFGAVFVFIAFLIEARL